MSGLSARIQAGGLINANDLMSNAFAFMGNKDKFVNKIATLRERHSHLKWAHKLIDVPEKGTLPHKSKRCFSPGCVRLASIACPGCTEVRYCSISCRELHWKDHGQVCRKLPSPGSQSSPKWPNLGSIKSFFPRKFSMSR